MSTLVHLGVDLGSTETKVVAHDDAGRALAEATARTSWTVLPGGGAQTTGAALLGGVLTALAGLADALPGPWQAGSLAVAGLGESGVLLDPRGDEAAPVIAWFDVRGTAEVATLAPGLAAEFPRRTGLRLDSQPSAAKLAWGRAHGWALAAGSCWLSVPEFVVHALGGQRVAEPSLVSRTGLLDLDAGAAWPELAAALGLPAGLLPPLVAAGTGVGRAEHPGLPAQVRGAVLTVAGHDHPVAAIGAGATAGDVLFNGAGTADVLLRSVPGAVPPAARDALIRHGVSVGHHVLAGTSAVLGGVSAGLVLRRVLSLVGADEPAARARLDEATVALPRPVRGVEVRGGDREADGLRITLGDGVGPAGLLAAALEHVGAATADLVGLIEDVVGPRGSAVSCGGWTRMASVRAAKARVLPDVTFSPVGRPGCRGAALLGALAAAGTGQAGLPALAREWDATDPVGVAGSTPPPAVAPHALTPARASPPVGPARPEPPDPGSHPAPRCSTTTTRRPT